MSPHAHSEIDLYGRSVSRQPVPRQPVPKQSMRYRPAQLCAQCGDALYMPEFSEWLDTDCARHLWQCDACGYTFETTVHFAAA